MRSPTRRSLALVLRVGLLTAVGLGTTAPPAGAHGLGERADLPLSLPYFLVGSAIAVVAAFAVTSWFWPRPRLADASVGRVLPRPWPQVAAGARLALRGVGLFAFVVVLGAALFGADSAARNLTPVAIYVWASRPKKAANLRWPVRSQIPLVVAMVVYTVGGLALLLG